MTEKLPGIDERLLLDTVMQAAQGKGRISKQSLHACTFLLNKLIPNAGRDLDVETSGNSDYREIRICIIREPSPGDGVQLTVASGGSSGEPEAV